MLTYKGCLLIEMKKKRRKVRIKYCAKRVAFPFGLNGISINIWQRVYSLWV